MEEDLRKSLVYTKTGDTGTTALVGGMRVSKAHIRLEAYGTIDELNSFVGWLVCEIKDTASLTILSFIQHKLFTVGSYLATETQASPKVVIVDADIVHLEKEIDRMDSMLPRLKKFVLPGGNEAASRAHICRTVSRRAERTIYHVNEIYPVDEFILKFVNRLSDYFFLLARHESNKSGEEIFWDNTCR